MSDNLYQWRSKLTLKGGQYQGCATLANLDPTLEWSGVYFASSTEQTGFSVSLTLEKITPRRLAMSMPMANRLSWSKATGSSSTPIRSKW